MKISDSGFLLVVAHWFGHLPLCCCRESRGFLARFHFKLLNLLSGIIERLHWFSVRYQLSNSSKQHIKAIKRQESNPCLDRKCAEMHAGTKMARFLQNRQIRKADFASTYLTKFVKIVNSAKLISL